MMDPNNGIHYITIYRPPPSQANGFTLAKFYEEFEEFLQELSLLPGKLVMLGDFNIHVNEPTKAMFALD